MTKLSRTNGYQQDVCVLVLEPSANKHSELIIAEGGTPINDALLGHVAARSAQPATACLSRCRRRLLALKAAGHYAVGVDANANHLVRCWRVGSNASFRVRRVAPTLSRPRTHHRRQGVYAGNQGSCASASAFAGCGEIMGIAIA